MPAIKDLTHLNEILAVLNRRPAGPKNRRSYFSTFEQILSGLSIASLVGSIIIVLLAKISWMPRASAMAWSFGLLGFGEIGYFVVAAVVAWSTIRDFMKQTKESDEQHISTIRSSAIQLDYLRLSQLCSFPSEDLEYLSERLQLEAENLRSRIGLFLGAIDKVGIIPLVVGSMYTAWKFAHEAALGNSFITIGLAGLGLAYFAGMALTVRSHRLNELVQLLKLAASKADEVPAQPSSPLMLETVLD